MFLTLMFRLSGAEEFIVNNILTNGYSKWLWNYEIEMIMNFFGFSCSVVTDRDIYGSWKLGRPTYSSEQIPISVPVSNLL